MKNCFLISSCYLFTQNSHIWFHFYLLSILGQKLPFFTIFLFFRLFSPRWGVKKYFFDQKWFKHILTTFLYIENTIMNHKTVFGRICRGILHISGTRFIGIFLYFCENPENGPNNMVGGFCVRGQSYQNPFGSWPFWSHRSQIKKNWTLTNFFPLCSNIAPTSSEIYNSLLFNCGSKWCFSYNIIITPIVPVLSLPIRRRGGDIETAQKCTHLQC